MSLKNWYDNKIGSKLTLFKGIKGVMSGDSGDMSEIMDLVSSFITPETSREIAHSIAGGITKHENNLNCNIIYLLRKTPDGNSVFIDVVKTENGIMIETLHQYTENDLANLLTSFKNG